MLAHLQIFLCAPVFGIDFLFVSFFFFLATSTILCNDMSITFRRESVEQWRDKTNYVDAPRIDITHSQRSFSDVYYTKTWAMKGNPLSHFTKRIDIYIKHKHTHENLKAALPLELSCSKTRLNFTNNLYQRTLNDCGSCIVYIVSWAPNLACTWPFYVIDTCSLQKRWHLQRYK